MKGIKIIHEAVEHDPEFVKAREALLQAEYIAFLGFGYHPANLKRLRMHECAGSVVQGTTFGMTGAETARIKAYVPALHANNYDVFTFLRESGALFR